MQRGKQKRALLSMLTADGVKKMRELSGAVA